MSYRHDPVVENPAGLLVIQVGVGDGVYDGVSSSIEGASCSVQPDGVHILHLTREQNQRHISVSKPKSTRGTKMDRQNLNLTFWNKCQNSVGFK